MGFLPLSRRRSSARNVSSGEERGETDFFPRLRCYRRSLNKNRSFYGFLREISGETTYAVTKRAAKNAVSFYNLITIPPTSKTWR